MPPECPAPAARAVDAPGLVGVALAAGRGERLRPLTDHRPKPLCPVHNEPLLQRALRFLDAATEAVAVNVHAHPEIMAEYLSRWPDVKVSVEDREPLGTAGAIGRLLPWVAGRPVMVTNSDTWLEVDPAPFLLDGWDGIRTRLLVVEEEGPADFGRHRYIGTSLMPWAAVAGLVDRPSGLYEVLWRSGAAEGTIELVDYPAAWFDCGTPRRYLEANLYASGGATVVAPGTIVEGRAERSVLWPGAHVAAGECLYEAIRLAPGLTVQTEPETC